MTSLGELAAYMPVSEARLRHMVRTMWGRALVSRWAGTTGTTGRLSLLTLPHQLVMSFNCGSGRGWIWSALFLCVIFLLNLHFRTRFYGEASARFYSLIKSRDRYYLHHRWRSDDYRHL